MMRVLLLAPNIDGADVGEAFVAFKWAEALARITDLTVLSFERPGRTPLADQLPDAQVVTWNEPEIFLRHERLNAMLKPAYPLFCRYVRRWLSDALRDGTSFDIAHQLMPQAARYAIPLRHFPVPYVVGPLGGALQTPEAFRKETGAAPLFTRLRQLDGWRLRHDPWLRKSYGGAQMVLGVAPYMADVLKDVEIKRFEPVLELGIDALAPDTVRTPPEDGLKLLHVGRGVRTKGLRDAVRALAHLRDRPAITLTSAGAGEEIEACKAEADRLGVAGRVRFLGRIARAGVEELYASHDVFVFPSFREAAGGVLYEALRWGLPVITAKRGGPDWIVDDSCGLRIPVSDPDQYARDIATGAARLADDHALRQRLGEGARAKVLREGLWPQKAAALVRLYEQAIGDM